LAQSDVILEVEPDAMSSFVDAMADFVRENGYEMRSNGPSLLEFSCEGPHANMTTSQLQAGIFRVAFEARPPSIWELWIFDFDPDVGSIANDFRRVMLRVDGVHERKTPPHPLRDVAPESPPTSGGG
jgi:hypothetical protein